MARRKGLQVGGFQLSSGNATWTALPPEVGTRPEIRAGLGPKLDYRAAVGLEQPAKRRQRETTNISWISLDAFDKWSRPSLERKGSRLVERLPGGHVQLDLTLARTPEC